MLTAEELEKGRRGTLPDELPEKTLAWGIVDWAEKYLAQPDRDTQGNPWHFVDEQIRFLAHFYAVDERGRFPYRRAMLMRAKGAGKSPLLAALSCIELLGPVVFDGWDAYGNPVGKPQRNALVQLCAVSHQQVGNTLELAQQMLREGPAIDEYSLDVGTTRILAPGGSAIRPVTASVRSREGQRVTFAVLDETHLWVPAEHGPELAAVVRRNLGKMARRSVETTNAYMPGEQSVAESSYNTWLKGQRGFLLDYRAAPPGTNIRDKAELMQALAVSYGDSEWIDLDWIYEETQDEINTEADVKRFYLNLIVQGSAQWMDPERWAATAVEPVEIEEGARITLGFDGGVHDDSTALVGCRVSDGHIFPIKVWERPENEPDWTVDKAAVKAKIRDCFARYEVIWMDADPAYWQDDIGELAIEFPDRVFAWWTNRSAAMAKCLERFHTAIHAGEITHDDDPTLTRHVLNATRDEKPMGILIKKDVPKSMRKIDAAIAACLAYEARAEWLEAESEEDEPGEVWGF